MIGRKHLEQELLDLYDGYAHGQLSRRDFLDRAGAVTTTGLSAAALLSAMSPDYALAQQVAADDPRITTEYQDYASPDGAGEMRGYLVKPAAMTEPRPGVVVIHENRGLNPYIEDVTRRVGLAGYVAFAPDALTPLGGYPGDDDAGRIMQRERSSTKMLEDFVAAVRFTQKMDDCNGKVACVGFCFGGWVSNMLAVRVPDLAGAVPFYGGQPADDDVALIKAPLMIHLGGLDTRVNAGWPAYRDALDANAASYVEFTYEDANHGFHNDTTPRYDAEAADLAWSRTLDFFAAVFA